MADWNELLLQALSDKSFNAMIRSNRRPVTALPYWRTKLFAVLAGIQDNVDGYLDLFRVIMNDPTDKMEKSAMILDRTMRCPKTLSFLNYYGVSAR